MIRPLSYGLMGPLRGIANLAQGKFKKGLGAFGDTDLRWGEGGDFGDVMASGAGSAAASAAPAPFAGAGPLNGIGNMLVGPGESIGSYGTEGLQLAFAAQKAKEAKDREFAAFERERWRQEEMDKRRDMFLKWGTY